MLTVGSLFSGIGGFDLGLERAGMSVRWQVENNGWCQRVLAKHWPAVPRYGDITGVDWTGVEPVNLVCGGFPCQPFSVAGKRGGKADNRYLWPEVVRCLTTLRPAWFVGENVPGIVKLALDQVYTDLEDLGYTVQAFNIPACAVDAPHRRARIWIVAYLSSERLEGASRTQLQGNSVRLASSRKDVADTIIGGLDGKGLSAMQRERVFESPRGGERSGRLESAMPWTTEPDVGRVAHGVPRRVDRLRGLGNAVVPQVVERLGRMILTVEAKHD